MATINVTSTADSGAGTLRQAITDLNAQTGSHTITFTGLTGTITLASVLPTLSRSMTITGPGLSNLTISGNNLYRVFVLGSATLTFNISGLTIANGRAASAYPGYIGGGIYNPSSGSSSTLNVDSCYFTALVLLLFFQVSIQHVRISAFYPMSGPIFITSCVSS